jgi:hypothetical protein
LKTEILDVTFGEKPENRKTEGKREKTKKKRYFTEIEPYLYEFNLMQLNHVLAFTHEKPQGAQALICVLNEL